MKGKDIEQTRQNANGNIEDKTGGAVQMNEIDPVHLV